MKIIIAGGRDFTNYDLLDKEVTFILNSMVNIPMGDMEIVSGLAKGADERGTIYAFKNKFKLHKFPADWNKYGKGAGPIRNRQMAEFSDVLIAFWGSKSRGTKNMIDVAKELGLKVYIINY